MRGLRPVERVRGVELLDDPGVDPAVRERSHLDIVVANTLLGGRRAVLLALRPLFDGADAARLPDGTRQAPRAPAITLLDVGTGLADIPCCARELAGRRGLRVRTIGLDGAPMLLVSARRRLDLAVCGNGLALPFEDRSIDIAVCSQLLHHFEEPHALRLLAELDRVARRLVIVSDLRRSRIGAVGFWAASVALGFHPVTRHDGTVSVLRGFTEAELGDMVLTATGARPTVRRRLGYRLIASWTPTTSDP